MAESPASRVAPRRQVSWVVGGSLLIFSAVVGGVAPQIGYPAMAWVHAGSSVLFAAATLVFAFGIPDGASVTARRPVGTTALAVLAVWPLISLVMWATQGQTAEVSPFQATIAYVDMALPLLAGLIAVVAIARAGVVPAPWNWAPTWALVALAVPNVLAQLLFVAVPADVQQVTPLLATLGTLVAVGVPVFLGVLALVLAQRPLAQRPLARRPVPVYPPPTETDR